MNDILVAFFSHSGNTRRIANEIHEHVGGDIFEIMTIDPYPVDYDTIVDQTEHEKKNDYRPELAAEVHKIGYYHLVFIGYPNWWGTMPMAVFAFLEKHDFSGKVIIPFCTYENGGLLGTSIRDIKKLCPDANVFDGLAIRGSYASKAKNDVLAWLNKIDQINAVQNGMDR